MSCLPRLLRRLAIAVGSALGALLLVEGALRAAGYAPFAEALAVKSWVLRESDHPDLSYELVPGARGRAWGTSVEVSSQGLRDREYALPKPPGVVRLAVLGDSVAFGNGLRADLTFPELLESSLASRGLEVLNLSVGGYDILDEVARLEHTGFALEPDRVLVGYCVNDVGVHSANLTFVRALVRSRAWWMRLRIGQWWARRLAIEEAHNSVQRENDDAVFEKRFSGRIAPVQGDVFLAEARRTIAERLRELRARGREVPFLSWYTSEAKLGRLRYALERLAEDCRSRDLPCSLAFLPYLGFDTEPQGWAMVVRILEHECTRVGIEFLDLHACLEGIDPAHLRIRAGDDLHLAAPGHRRIAEVLRGWAEGWLDGGR